MSKKYIVNGVEYDSLDKVPAEHRASIESFEKITSGEGSSLVKVIRLLFSSLRESRTTEPATADSLETKSPERAPTGFFRSRQFRIMIVVMIAAGIIYVMSRQIPGDDSSTSPEPTTLSPEQTSEPEPESVTTTESNNGERFSLTIEDPNEPPYQVFVALYDNGRLRLRMDMPPGEFVETEEPNTIVINAPAEEGTNLARKEMTLLWSNEFTTASWPQITIGKNTFYHEIEDDYAAGHRYITSSYAYVREDGVFMVKALYVIRSATDGPVPDYDIENDVPSIESLLSTLEVID